MRRKEQLNSIIEICPIRNIVARFGNKWALLVMLVISENAPVRYNELLRKIPDLSSRVLSLTLRTLEADGLVSRKLYNEVPARVEYSLTDIGQTLIPIIMQLTEWAQKNLKNHNRTPQPLSNGLPLSPRLIKFSSLRVLE